MSGESDDSTQKEELVITPGGPRPTDRVHLVGSGEAVYVDESGNAKVVPREQEEGTVNMAEEMVLTPGGYRPKSLVHLIEPGHLLDGASGHLRKLDPSGHVVADFGPVPPHLSNAPLMPRTMAVPLKEVAALGSGWIANVFWNNNTRKPISSFTTTWIVPRPPATQSGQLIYLFNGIQTNTWIYQPVLQWGSSGSSLTGGGNYWAVASWYVQGSNGPAFYSPLTQVNPGDVLTGEITLTNQANGLFSYNCQFQGIANSAHPIQNVQELTQAVVTLEAYRITKCSDYPDTDGMVFLDNNIKTGNDTPMVTWTPMNSVTDCKQHVMVLSNSNPGGEVIIYDRQANPLSLSLRQFLTTHGANPSNGVRKFIQDQHRSGISHLRALLESFT